jgi:uncharacterized Zn-binding protein involved in type VI secretion
VDGAITARTAAGFLRAGVVHVRVGGQTVASSPPLTRHGSIWRQSLPVWLLTDAGRRDIIRAGPTTDHFASVLACVPA